jgi:hypothetical protein
MFGACSILSYTKVSDAYNQGYQLRGLRLLKML